MKNLIQNYSQWSLNENLGFASDFFDPASLDIVEKIWQNLDYLHVAHNFALLEFSGKSVGVYLSDDESANARYRDIGGGKGIIELNKEALRSRKHASIIFHEILHSIFDEKLGKKLNFDPDNADSKTAKKFYRAHDKNFLKKPDERAHVDDVLSNSHGNDYLFYLTSNDEVSSYMGQLYLVAMKLHLQHKAKVESLLRKGDTSGIFQLLPKEDLHRVVHQIYFGGDDREAITELKKLPVATRSSTLAWNSESEREKAAEKGVTSFMSSRDAEKFKKKFQRGLYTVIFNRGELKEGKVWVQEGIYQMLSSTGLLEKYSVEREPLKSRQPAHTNSHVELLITFKEFFQGIENEYTGMKRPGRGGYYGAIPAKISTLIEDFPIFSDKKHVSDLLKSVTTHKNWESDKKYSGEANHTLLVKKVFTDWCKENKVKTQSGETEDELLNIVSDAIVNIIEKDKMEFKKRFS